MSFVLEKRRGAGESCDRALIGGDRHCILTLSTGALIAKSPNFHAIGALSFLG